MAHVLDTRVAGAGEGFGYFRETMSRAALPVEVRAAAPAVFWARLCTVELKDVTLVSVRSGPGSYDVARTASTIGKSDPEAYRVVVNVSGTSGFRHCDRSVVLGPGQMGLYDSSRPFEGWRDPGAGGQAHMIMATFPRHELPLEPRRVRTLLGAQLPAGQGVGLLLREFLTQIGGENCPPLDGSAHRLAAVWLDLVAVHLGDTLELTAPAVRTSADRTMFLRIRQFIDANLNDIGLTPEAIAAAHFISLRTLQRLFAEQDLTVACWIRTRRLEKCRDDLRNPLLVHHSVHAISARWGFTDQAHFSRAFRRAYGMSPRAYRLTRSVNQLARNDKSSAAASPRMNGLDEKSAAFRRSP